MTRTEDGDEREMYGRHEKLELIEEAEAQEEGYREFLVESTG